MASSSVTDVIFGLQSNKVTRFVPYLWLGADPLDIVLLLLFVCHKPIHKNSYGRDFAVEPL